MSGNRYRSPAKRKAYSLALNLAKVAKNLNAADAATIVRLVKNTYGLTKTQARDVAAKAIRVERGKRVKRRKEK